MSRQKSSPSNWPPGAPGVALVDRMRVSPQHMSDAELRDHVINLARSSRRWKLLLHSRLPQQLHTSRNAVRGPRHHCGGRPRRRGHAQRRRPTCPQALAGVLTWWVPGCRERGQRLGGGTGAARQRRRDGRAVRLVWRQDPLSTKRRCR